jgi:hypothetical protein
MIFTVASPKRVSEDTEVGKADTSTAFLELGLQGRRVWLMAGHGQRLSNWGFVTVGR